MKAMPPTKGHERLIDFARGFCENGVVLMDCAPGEPMVDERASWLNHKVPTGISGWYSWALRDFDDQDPDSNGFWERWKNLLATYGKLDYVIGSEPYCEKVAECIGARYIPYDPGRELAWVHATQVREHPLVNFAQIDPDFQKHLRTTVTIFGAESTGKTTLSRNLARRWSAVTEWTFEWARPYLEATHQTVVDLQAMHDIWNGQYSVEENADRFAVDKAFIIRDTDLYSTIGYWEQPHWVKDLGPVPKGLIQDANKHKADLYIITQSDIPFEKDPLRYGGDHRESPDDYWIGVAEKYGLNYVVLTGKDRDARLFNAQHIIKKNFEEKNSILKYSRELVAR